jgi:hypothetical protein
MAVEFPGTFAGAKFAKGIEGCSRIGLGSSGSSISLSNTLVLNELKLSLGASVAATVDPFLSALILLSLLEIHIEENKAKSLSLLLPDSPNGSCPGRDADVKGYS